MMVGLELFSLNSQDYWSGKKQSERRDRQTPERVLTLHLRRLALAPQKGQKAALDVNRTLDSVSPNHELPQNTLRGEDTKTWS